MSSLEPIESTEIIDPMSGQVVDAADPVKAAELLDAMRQSKLILDQAIRRVTEVLSHEFERQGTRTINAGPWELESKETASFEWDMEELEKLKDAGLPDDRFGEFVNATITYKPKQNIAKQLETNPAYRVIIEEARTRVVKGVRVDVRRAKGAIEQ